MEFSFKAMFPCPPVSSAPGSTGHPSGQYWTGAKFTAHRLPSLTHCLGLLASPLPTGSKASQEQDEAQGTEAAMKWGPQQDGIWERQEPSHRRPLPNVKGEDKVLRQGEQAVQRPGTSKGHRKGLSETRAEYGLTVPALAREVCLMLAAHEPRRKNNTLAG